MRCPFLREAQVKFCCASEFRRMVVRSQGDESRELCSSSSYVTCPWVKQHNEEIPSQDRCPFLQESLVQYCSEASVIKYVPYSDPSLSRCGTSSHRYCELFLMISHPNLLVSHEVDAPTISTEDGGPWIVDGIQITGWHYYSANHMWLEVDEDGICHIGVDPFFAKVIGNVSKLAFVTNFGEHYPGVVLTVSRQENREPVDFPMIFPNRIRIKSTNTYLRAEPNRIINDPYTFGWMFEGALVQDDPAKRINPFSTSKQSKDKSVPNLIHGRKVREWMRSETRRLSEFINSKCSMTGNGELETMTDGGFNQDVVAHLNKDQIMLLYSEFFSPNVKLGET
jgi:glycine cleavage system H lipoate-binding protein